MKRLPLFIQHLTCLIIFVLTLMIPSAARAQEGETPQIALSVVQASPGATIEITGGHFEPDVLIAFILFQNGNQIQIGTFFANWHGDFSTPVLLPYDLQPGQYEFRAVDERNRLAVAPLEIVPDPSSQENGQQREEEDPLLAPMPTLVPAMAPASSVQPDAPIGSDSSQQAFIVAGVLMAVMLVLIIGWKKMKRS